MIQHIALNSIDDILAFLKAAAAPGSFNIFRGTRQYSHSLKTSVERTMTPATYPTLGYRTPGARDTARVSPGQAPLPGIRSAAGCGLH